MLPPSENNEKSRHYKYAFFLNLTYIKVPITPKYFFPLNKSLHLFETQCAFLPLFNPNIDLLQAVKVTKSGYHLSHDRASKGYGSTPCLTSQTSLHACLQRLKTESARRWSNKWTKTLYQDYLHCIANFCRTLLRRG